MSLGAFETHCYLNCWEREVSLDTFFKVQYTLKMCGKYVEDVP